MREKAESKKKNKGGGGQGNQTGRTRIVQPLRAEQTTVKQGAGNMQNANGVPPRTDPCFPQVPTIPQYIYDPISQLSAQLNSLREEMRDLRTVILSNQINSVSVPEVEMDDTVISVLTPEEMMTDDRIFPSHTPAADVNEENTDVDGALEEFPRDSRLHTLITGEQKFVETPVTFSVSGRSQFRSCGVISNKPSIWASLLTIILFMNFWSHGLVDRTFAAA
ncbi:MAG: hypothetical protein GY696_01180 [Gammaproteobacteria bacterium]|nr:hypothetical protein [Gammaproteobacteria bacterium]